MQPLDRSKNVNVDNERPYRKTLMKTVCCLLCLAAMFLVGTGTCFAQASYESGPWSSPGKPLVTAGGAFDDIPVDAWPYEALNRVESVGVEPGYPAKQGSVRAKTRAEFATVILQQLDRLNRLDGQLGGQARTNLELVFALQDLVTEFAPPLNRLGLDVPGTQAYLRSFIGPMARSMSRNFSDVPYNHWAKAAVERVRKAGILIGYPPNGSFHSHQPRQR